LKEHLLAIHKIHPYFGYKQMTRGLSRVNHKRVRRFMRELGIQSVIRKKRPFYGRFQEKLNGLSPVEYREKAAA
jgi:putative transposase